jgi:hypothetical protein
MNITTWGVAAQQADRSGACGHAGGGARVIATIDAALMAR